MQHAPTDGPYQVGNESERSQRQHSGLLDRLSRSWSCDCFVTGRGPNDLVYGVVIWLCSSCCT